MNGLPGRGLAALASAALWTGGAFAQSQSVPQVISPLRVETDHNNVNIVSGKTTIEPPALAVPGAPNLRYDRVQNAAPYARGTVTGQGESVPIVNWSVHTGSGSSESFVCADWQDCSSVTGTGSTFRGSAGANASGVYRQAGSGALWNFNLPSASSGQVRQAYASQVTYPNGEIISYTYDSAVVGIGQTVYRATRIDSNMGYRITIAYRSGDPYNIGWGSPSEAAIYNFADLGTPLGRLTYNAEGTITDLGGRVYACTGCSNALGTDLETADGTMQLPGESGPSLQVAHVASGQPLVGSVVRDGVSYSYAYTYNGGAPFYQAQTNSYLYTQLAVTGPSGFNQVYQLVQTGTPNQKRNVIASVTDSIARVSTFQFDLAYRPVQVNYPEGNAVRILYDDRGNIVERRAYARPGTGLADLVETAAYPDAPSGMPNLCTMMCWRAIWSRDALNRQTDYLYNASGQLTEQLDPADANGVRRRTSTVYEIAGGISRRRAVRICADTGTTCGTNAPTQTEYDYAAGDNRLLPSAERRIDVAQNVTLTTNFSYDAAGRLTMTDGPLDGLADATYIRYDVFGRKAWEIGALAPNGLRIATRFSYRDSDDRPVSSETGTIPDANSTALSVFRRTDLSYDSRRNPAREAVSSGGTTYGVTDKAYDDRGRLVCTAVRMNPAAFAATPGACALGAQGAAGPDRIASSVYDAAGQRLQLREGVGTADEGTEATWAYNLNGQVTTVIDGNGNRAELRYDGHGRQDRWTLPSATRPTAYNDATQATALATAGAVNAGDYEEYGYDAAGNRTSLRKRDGRNIAFAYDALNRVTARTYPQGGATPVYYSYDLQNLQLSARFTSPTGEGIANTYDGFGRLTSSTTTMGGTSRALSYGYDPAGNRIRITHPDGNRFEMDYDALGRPTILWGNEVVAFAGMGYYAHGGPAGRSLANGATSEWGFDAIQRVTAVVQNAAGTSADLFLSLGYNPAGQIASRNLDNDAYAWTGHYAVNRPYTTNGLNQYTAAGGPAMSYDPNGNLTSDGANNNYVYDIENRLVSASGAHNATLAYDPLGRLSQLTAAGITTTFLYDGDALVAEYEGATLRHRYAHWAGSDVPLLSFTDSDFNSPYYLHADQQGSVVMLSGAGTPIINRYDEYGIPQSTNTGRFQYTGQAYLPELGLYYYKARIYSPTLGRFLQTDPVGYAGQFNLYGYAEDDPINGTDPTGLTPVMPNTCSRVGSIDCSGSYAGAIPTAQVDRSAGRTQLAMNYQPEEENARTRRGFLGIETDPTAETRTDRYYGARTRLEEIEPLNPAIRIISSPDWVPSERATGRMETELANAQDRQAISRDAREYLRRIPGVNARFSAAWGSRAEGAMAALRENRPAPAGVSRQTLQAYRNAINGQRYISGSAPVFMLRLELLDRWLGQ